MTAASRSRLETTGRGTTAAKCLGVDNGLVRSDAAAHPPPHDDAASSTVKFGCRHCWRITRCRARPRHVDHFTPPNRQPATYRQPAPGASTKAPARRCSTSSACSSRAGSRADPSQICRQRQRANAAFKHVGTPPDPAVDHARARGHRQAVRDLPTTMPNTNGTRIAAAERAVSVIPSD